MAGLEYRKLEASEIEAGVAGLDGWRVEGDLLTKEFDFASYAGGLLFAVAVGHLAEGLDHHPDLHVGYRKVRVAMSTHSVNGLSPYDFELARRIDGLTPTGS